MPRKSRKLRLEQAIQLSDAWSNTVFRNDWRHRFIGDMIKKLEADKGTSTKQRAWLDSLIHDGVPGAPENMNVELSRRVEVAIEAFNSSPGSEWESGVLKDFHPRIVLGKELSEKQTSLLTNLLSDADAIINGTVWSPSPDQIIELKNAVNVYKGYSPMWRSERPAVRRAVEATTRYISEGGRLKQRDAEKLLKSVAGRMKGVTNPRFKTGDIGKYNINGTVQRLICMSDVRVTEDGSIVNDWLAPDGTLKTAHADRIYKR